MAARKTLKFLPTIFQTDINNKFLSATVDQLVSEPNLQNIYGYIGRKFAPTYKNKDSYILETSKERQNYQLEPSVVIDDGAETTFFVSYIDLLNKIEYYGGLVDNHSRLFSNEYYSFNPRISFDKFVNFIHYYWLPDGPDPVDVFTGGIQLEKEYIVSRNSTTNRYEFTSGGVTNDTIILARGGQYRFVVNQPGVPFWIQSELGLDGRLNATPTISSRDVLGVDNNGADVGTVTFIVPQENAQQRFAEMRTVFNADYAVPLAFSQLHNTLLSVFLERYPQYQGLTGQLNGKTLIFVDQENLTNFGEAAWAAGGIFDEAGFQLSGFDAGEFVPTNLRYGVWRVLFTPGGTDDPIIKLVYVQDVALNEKVFIRYGLSNANREFYKDYDGFFYRVPLLTSLQETLFYQDGASSEIYGQIKIVDSTGWKIDVERDILGKKNYTSPNGVEFTSGLKVRFDVDVLPASYQNKEYYVENVGDSIRLVDTEVLVTPEDYNDELAINYPDQAFPDYITITRCSLDLNAWARNNRWFHVDVINATARYNNVVPQYDQLLRAQRPIIQFEPDYQLINEGRVAKLPIDVLDTVTTDVFSALEGSPLTEIDGVSLLDGNGDPLPNGLRVLFVADPDPLVFNRIYTVKLIQTQVDPPTGLPTGPTQIKIEPAEDADSLVYNTVTVKNGTHKGTQWWFDGAQWYQSQAKTGLNQEPLFDLFDRNGVSLADYPGSTFEGTRIFGYKRNESAIVDPVLGFGLTYRNFGTQGDIEFTNYFYTDTFNYTEGSQTVTAKTATGFLHKIIDLETKVPANIWSTVVEKSKQYQLLNFTYTDSNVFRLDITPDSEQSIPYLKVYQNNRIISSSNWNFDSELLELTVNTTLSSGDKIDVLIYSSSVSELGHYQVPLNLDLNAQNIDLESLTLGQVRNHLIAISQNSKDVKGDILGVNNLRDLEVKQQGGNILQHSAPVPPGALFLFDEQANFINALRFAQQEYTKFKNKFLDLATTLPGIDPQDPVSSVDLILTELNRIKNNTFPWFYSDMAPYGTLKTIVNDPGYTVFNPLVRSYEITNVFSTNELSNRAVLVYLNSVQLVVGKDYTFDTDRPAITFADSVTLQVDDLITIVEYSNTDGNYIPETPTKLGLYPRFIPEIYLDDSYSSPINVVRGHDGSTTPAFEDYRDEFLLELEKRIYNNIKVAEELLYEDIYEVLPGKFRTSDYNLNESTQLLSKSFLNWVGNNKLDFASNETFNPNDAFSWNYSRFIDRVDGESLPGSWRACYQYFYDTDSPDRRPWEMLGFSNKPDWWEDYYGPAPYTGGNKLLWEDLEAGRIVQGPRAGEHAMFARPGLSRIVPVDANGNLYSPAQILTLGFDSNKTNTAWGVGQWGPVETAWRHSSDFPYAVQMALALAKPAMFFGELADVSRYEKYEAVNQYLTNTNAHINQSEFVFNGQISAGAIVRTAGYINWIADYLRNNGIDPEARLMPLVKNYSVKLAYKMAGFSDQKYLQVLAEQSSPTSTNDSIIVPNESYRLYLNKSSPVNKLSYSAVIVEKTNAGFTVRGYNVNDPYFTIIPSVVSSNSYKITVLNNEAVVFRDYDPIKITVPYGYEFKNQQQVVDFLISYERYLLAQGFVFDSAYDDVLKEIRNWKLSAKEFLFWAQQGWAAGSVLVLSPVVDTVNVITIGAVVDEITDSQYGSRILDQNFKLVKNTNYNVLRSPTDFQIKLLNGQVIGFVELNLVQYEHALIFDNTTVFNDIIYKPELGNRQFRLKLIGQKTGDWDGSLSAPGFIYNSGAIDQWQPGKDYFKGELVEYKNQYYVAMENVVATTNFDFKFWKTADYSKIKKGLLPNWSSNAVKGQSYYDAYGYFNDADQIKYSHGLIGYKPRQYLDDLGLNETTQVEFYKGYIRQKGSANAVNALTQAQFNNLNSAIEYYEEWAVRVGEYGASGVNPFLEIALDEKAFAVNPALAEFVPYTEVDRADGINVFANINLYKTTPNFTGNIALDRTSSSDYDNDIPTAGYVNVNDVDATLFDIQNYQELNNLIPEMGNGYTIWVAKDFTRDWNVFRVTETNVEVREVTNALDGYVTFRTNVPHGLSANDVFLVRSFDAGFDGFYQVYRVVDLNRVMVLFYGDATTLTSVTGNGVLFRLDSLRFYYMEDSRIYGLTNPPNGWQVGEKIWIDYDAETTEVQGQPYSPTKTWKVYEKKHPWTVDQSLIKNTNEYQSNDRYGSSVKINDSAHIIVAGSSLANAGVGTVTVFDKDTSGEFVETQVVLPPFANARSFGHSIDMSGNLAIEVTFNTLNPGEYITANVGDILTQTATGANLKVLGNVVNSPKVLAIHQSANVATVSNSSMLLNGNVANVSIAAITSTGAEYVERMVVGAPNTSSNVGAVYIYAKTYGSDDWTIHQTIYGPNANSRYGYSVSLDEQGWWLFVGAPDEDRVYVYGLDRKTTNQYQLITSIGAADYGAPAGCEFGYSLDSSLDGAQLGIGAPADIINVAVYSATIGSNVVTVSKSVPVNVATPTFLIDGVTYNLVSYEEFNEAGSVFVVDRVIEAQNAKSGNVYYETEETIKSVYRVTVDDIEIPFTAYSASSTLVQFTNPSYVPEVGEVVKIETNTFTLLEKLISIDSLDGSLTAIQRGARFGTSFTICSNNCAFYVGAPYYDNGPIYNTGAVWKFHNKGRLYGTNLGFARNPVFNRNDRIRLDNFTVEVSSNVGTITLSSAGTNYSQGARVTFANPDKSWGNVATANISIHTANGSVQSVTLTSGGDGYLANTSAVVTRAANVVTTGTTYYSSNTTVKVNSTAGLYVGMRANIGFASTATITAIYTANSNVIMSSANTSVMSNTPVTFYDAGAGAVLTTTVKTTATLDNLVRDINGAALIGISAAKVDDRLQINSDKTVAKNLLRILSGSGSVYADAEMAVFAFMQIIVNPYGSPYEYFGDKVILARNAYMLVISSERGTTRSYTTFDNDRTIFDTGSTAVFDAVKGSGSVYIYELYDDPRDEVEHPGRYAYCQQLNTGDLNPGDQFGAAIDIIGDYIAVTSPADDTFDIDGNPATPDNSGSVYVFTNPTGERGWKLIRWQQPTVDVESVNRLFIYNKMNNTILSNLEFIDPAKGKILGQAEQEISYKTAYDPAVYNRGDSIVINVNEEIHWNSNQIGKVWWNLDLVRFIDYEQDTLSYRTINWGNLFPGSIVEICEWVESDVLPSEYVAAGLNGVPKYADNSAYVETLFVDPLTNAITSKYYYWVTDKTTLDRVNSTRNLPTTSIRTLIENPKINGNPYAAIVRNDAVILYNLGPYLSADDTILHIDYEYTKNQSIIHSEYELIQKNNANAVIPPKILTKMFDSLAGKDSAGNLVPDPNLSVADKYGISYRPRQSMFEDRVRALSVLIDYVNGVFIDYPIVQRYNLDQLYDQEARPSNKVVPPEYDLEITTEIELEYIDTTSLPIGYTVLVASDSSQEGRWALYELILNGSNKIWSMSRVQNYKTDLYWTHVDWYVNGYDQNTKVDYAVDTLVDAKKLPYAVGDLIRVASAGDGKWQLLLVDENKEFSAVGIQDGTIQLKSNLLNTGASLPAKEIRSVLNAIAQDIFIDQLAIEKNKAFFVMINYILTEQTFVDWIFKTSFITVNHQLRGLTQYPNYIKDNQTYYQDYINEVKPYATKIREYLVNYNRVDDYSGDITDFDLPAYYDTELDIFRSPDGSFEGKDQQLWATGMYIDTVINKQYPQWYENRTYVIDTIEIANPGREYTAVPVVEIYGDGVGAEAHAVINFDTGEVTSIVVDRPGSGYTRTPRIVINGNGIGATAYARLKNNQVRTFDQTLKFDRITYTSNVATWTANTTYYKTQFDDYGNWVGGNVVSYNGVGYKVTGNATINSGSIFNPLDYEVFAADEFTNAGDRIMAYYTPSGAMPAKDLKQLLYGVEYPGVKVIGGPGFGNDAAYNNVTIDSQIYSTYLDALLGTRPEDINIDGGAYVDRFSSHAPEELLPGITFDNLNMQVYTKIIGNAIVLGHRVLVDLLGDTTYTRISANSTVRLTREVTLTDDEIYVDDASKLIYPNPEENIPGVVFINGERIVFWRNYYYEVDHWVSNLAYSAASVVSYGNVITFSAPVTGTRGDYIIQPGTGANVQILANAASSSNVYVAYTGNVEFTLGSGNVQLVSGGNVANLSVYPTIITTAYWKSNEDLAAADEFDWTKYTTLSTVNVIAQLRRGTLGTAIRLVHPAGVVAIDGSVDQEVPGIITANVKFAEIQLNSTVSANVGDYITQTGTAANLRVIRSVTSSANVYVSYENSWLANVGTAYPIFVNSVAANRYITAFNNNATISNLHVTNTPVYDLLLSGNILPTFNDTITQANSSANVKIIAFNTVSAELIQLSSAISALSGSWLTQPSTGANAKIVTEVTSDDYVTVVYQTGQFTAGSGNLYLNGNILLSSTYTSSTGTWANVGIYPNNASSRETHRATVIGNIAFVFANATLGFSGNITANIGDIIRQPGTGANVTVQSNVAGANLVTVRYNSTTEFTLGSGNITINGAWPTANIRPLTNTYITAPSNLISLNGNVIANVNPVAVTLQGNVDVNGNVTVGNVSLHQESIWTVVGTGTATDGAGFEGAVSVTEPITFLADQPTEFVTSFDLITEDTAINIITEDGKVIFAEFGDY